MRERERVRESERVREREKRKSAENENRKKKKRQVFPNEREVARADSAQVPRPFNSTKSFVDV